MDQLRHLGLRAGWIYEALICTYSAGSPRATPAGVWTDDRCTLRMELYETSHTLASIVAAGEFVADFPVDASAFFQALHAPGELRFGRARVVAAPCLPDSWATVELTLSEASRRPESVVISGRVRHLTRRAEPRLINRAESLLLESLILATRIERSGREATLAALAENRRVVGKVAPGSAFEEAMSRLLRELRGDS